MAQSNQHLLEHQKVKIKYYSYKARAYFLALNNFISLVETWYMVCYSFICSEKVFTLFRFLWWCYRDLCYCSICWRYILLFGFLILLTFVAILFVWLIQCIHLLTCNVKSSANVILKSVTNKYNRKIFSLWVLNIFMIQDHSLYEKDLMTWLSITLVWNR